MNIKNNQKGFIVQGVIALVALVLIGGGAYYAGTKKDDAKKVPLVEDVSTVDWKTYTNSKDGYTFDYPTKLSLNASTDGVNLTHSIPFENTDGGCDMVGNAKVSKTLGDFNVLISVAPGQIKPPYADGAFSRGSLKGDWAYRGAEGCGQTVYYFPIGGNRTLIVTKQELQVLSPIVAPDVRNKVLAVPGVISYEESKVILDRILSSFKFTSPTNKVESKESVSETRRIEVISPKGGETYKTNQKIVISWNDYFGPDADTFTVALVDKKLSKIISSSFVRSSGIDGISSIEWTIPADLNGKYKIEVYPPGARELVARSNEFTITN